jgi:hypothetical protein
MLASLPAQSLFEAMALGSASFSGAEPLQPPIRCPHESLEVLNVHDK